MFRRAALKTITFSRCNAAFAVAIVGSVLTVIGCSSSKELEGPTVRQAVAQRYNDPPRKDTSTSDSADDNRNQSWTDQSPDDNDVFSDSANSNSAGGFAIATINGHDIAANHLSRMMLDQHGADALEQLIVLERARQRCEELGLTVSDVDMQREYDRRLKTILSPLVSGVDESKADRDSEFDREEAERILKGILKRRNISKVQYLSSIKRNSYLRAIANHEMQFQDSELRQEFEAHYAEQAVVRHIQLPNKPDAEKLRAMLADGLAFEDAASRHSANLRTGPPGGLLKPFGEGSIDIPEPLRRAAFGLDVGEVSEPIQVGPWWHLLKLEKKVTNGETDWAGYRAELVARLRERRADAQMQSLYRSLLEEADVKINDPELAHQYANRQSQLTQ